MSDSAAESADNFEIRPIRPDDMDRINMRCWPGGGDRRAKLMETQETLGISAWEGEKCVATLHCYQVRLPQWDDSVFPEWIPGQMHLWPLGWPLMAARDRGLTFEGPVWGHSCFHVGFLHDRSKPDNRYYGRGLASAMCRRSVQWAREKGYAAVLAQGGPADLGPFLHWMGVLPWTSYAKLGFETLALEDLDPDLPWWAQVKKATPETLSAVQKALARGRPARDLCSRVMCLRLD
jgi:hypothetical protein